MNINPNWKTAQSDFTALMYSKGYHASVNMRIVGDSGRVKWFRHLGDCLDDYLTRRTKGEISDSKIEFQTNVNNHITCTFTVKLDDVKGFLVKELYIYNKKAHDSRVYKGFMSNRQVPIAAHVISLFPKPKPWMNFYRGKFRP